MTKQLETFQNCPKHKKHAPKTCFLHLKCSHLISQRDILKSLNLYQILALCFLFTRTTAARTRRSEKRLYNLANDAIGTPECHYNRDPILPVGHIITPIQAPYQGDKSQMRRYRRAPSYKQKLAQATARRPSLVE